MIVSYDHQPSIIAPVGDGRFYYRWDIQEIPMDESLFPGISESEENENIEPAVQWKAQEVIVSSLKSNVITATVIAELWDASYEQKLVNDYNAAQLGVFSESEKQAKIEAYTKFLSDRTDIKRKIDKDCLTLGIK